MSKVPDYKELYIKMLRASEQAVRILTQAQRECEELYVSEPKEGSAAVPSDEAAPGPGNRPDGI